MNEKEGAFRGSLQAGRTKSKLIYSMGLSLDGFITGPDGSFDWSAPDEELHRGRGTALVP